ncbi:MAG: hypothetical protein QOF26_2213, partial [Baekduia sp.]|nr:hypothetical protein [Baekduia sp.]
ERDIAEARRSGSGSINELRSVKDRAKERWEQLLQQSMDETMPAR